MSHPSKGHLIAPKEARISEARCKELSAKLNKRYDNRKEKKELLEAVLAYLGRYERVPASTTTLGRRCKKVWGLVPSNLLYALAEITDGPLKVG